MTDLVEKSIDRVSLALESFGIVLIIVGLIYSFAKFFSHIYQSKEKSYENLRQNLGKTILLGLEVLVVADIIGTIMTKTTMEKVLILSIIVVIRILLGISIQVEINGEFPWNEKKNKVRYPDTQK